MNAFVWVLQGLLAFAFMSAGGLKVLRSKDAITANPRMGWARRLSAAQIKLFGAAEVLGALAIVEPWATGIVPVLTPIAAACFFVLLLVAAVVYARSEVSPALPLVLSVAAAVVACARVMELSRG